MLNTLLAYSPDGKLAARYDKIHLFGFTRGQESYDESRTIVAGQDVAVLETPQLRVGLSVCYDLRFPELFRAQAAAGATLLSVPAAFTAKTGAVHWHPLLLARAVENQCLVLAPGQCGTHPGGRRTHGHSLILGPWGETLAEVTHDEPGIAVAEIDLAQLDAVRQRFPALAHRRL